MNLFSTVLPRSERMSLFHAILLRNHRSRRCLHQHSSRLITGQSSSLHRDVKRLSSKGEIINSRCSYFCFSSEEPRPIF